MKIVVLIKSVPDTATQLRVADDGKTVITDDLESIMNPYDEFALEEAVRLKETSGGDVTVISMGSEEALKAIRQALALGADSAVLINEDDSARLSGRAKAKALAHIVDELAPDILFAGKQAVDLDGAQTPERIAEWLDFPHVSAITQFSLDDRNATVNRQLEGGHFIIEVPLPALFTAEKGLNEPRYPKLPDILKAKRKEIREVRLAEIGLPASELEQGVQTLSVSAPDQQRSAKIIGGETSAQVSELVSLLKTRVPI